MNRILLPTLFAFLPFHFVKGETPTPSQKIDQLVGAALKKQGIEPNGNINDEVFLRRTYLSIAGRVPTIEEAEAFHAENYPNKREQLIDKLINSEAYVSTAYHFWADLLRLNGEPGGAVGSAYELWVKNAIRENVSYDKMVYDLVTAEGKFWENGAIGYYMRDRGMPLDNMSNTVRIFLGTRLECAQCHNHPFDKWTQMDYFKMASFSYGMNTRNYKGGGNRDMLAAHVREKGERAYMAKAKELTGLDDFPYYPRKETLAKYIKYFPEKTEVASEPDPKNDDSKKAARARKKKRVRLTKHEELGMTKDEFVKVVEQCIEAAGGGVSYKKNSTRELLGDLYNPLQYINVSATEKESKLPHDYQYSDANPHDLVEPAAMFGTDFDFSKADSRIDGYGRWMTSPKNPTFTKVIVNRLWKEVFGLGIFEPVDELTDHTFYSNPELLAYLEDLMRELEYDIKRFQQVLYNTNTYQRGAFKGEVLLAAPFYFEGPLLRRMSAEQIWDSLVSLALPEADRYQPKLKSQLESIEKVRLIYKSLEERPFEEYVAMVEELSPLMNETRDRENAMREKLAKLRESGDEDAFREVRREMSGFKKELARKISDVAYVYLKERIDGESLLLAIGVMDAGTSMTNDPESEGESRQIMTKLPKPEKVKTPSDVRGKNRGDAKRLRREELRKQMGDYNIYRSLISNMARASELPSPAKRGHFLRDFGQSDREVIENASNHASVPQALNLLNGNMIQALTNKYSVFGKRLHEAGTPEEKTRMIFQALLTREPSEEELAIVKAEVEAKGEESYEGIVWALLNTQQFIFVQ